MNNFDPDEMCRQNAENEIRLRWSDDIIKLIIRVAKLEEHYTRQIDDNRKSYNHLIELEGRIKTLETKVYKLEARQEDARDLDRMDDQGKKIFRLFERIEKIQSCMFDTK